MARLQNFKRIIKENLPKESQALADTIGYSVNSFAEEVTNAFNKNISVDDNLSMEYKEIDLEVDGSGVPIIAAQIKTSLSGRIRGMPVIKLDNLTNPSTYPTSAPFVNFDQNNTLLTITHVTGLSTSNKYRLTLLLMK